MFPLGVVTVAARKRALRVATDADVKPAKPLTLSEAIAGEDYLAILLAQRRQMVDDVAEVQGPAKAALHRQIAIASKEIAALQATARQQAAEDAEATADDEPFDPEAL